MPLEHSSSPAAFKRNVSTLMGEIGQSPHVASRQQALRIAYETQRRAGQGKAAGGVAGYQMGGAPLVSGRRATRMIGPGIGTPMQPNPAIPGRPMTAMGGAPAQMPPVGPPGMGGPPGRHRGGVPGYQGGGSPMPHGIARMGSSGRTAAPHGRLLSQQMQQGRHMGARHMGAEPGGTPGGPPRNWFGGSGGGPMPTPMPGGMQGWSPMLPGGATNWMPQGGATSPIGWFGGPGGTMPMPGGGMAGVPPIMTPGGAASVGGVGAPAGGMAGWPSMLPGGATNWLPGGGSAASVGGVPSMGAPTSGMGGVPLSPMPVSSMPASVGGVGAPAGGMAGWPSMFPGAGGGAASPGVSATPAPMPTGGMPGGATTPPVGTNPAVGRQAGGSAEMEDQAAEVEMGESGSMIPPMGITPGPGPPQGSQMPGGMGGMGMKRAWGGQINMAKGPSLMPPSPMDRMESRQMMHGPVIGSTPGRADSRNTQVPSGSYVLPSSHIASMGQGNTTNGLAKAQSLFGAQGPYGAGMPKVTHGAGPPKPSMPSMKGMGVAPAPKVPKIAISGALGGMGGGNGGMGMSSEGGGRGHDAHVGRPVRVALSDGEFVIGPNIVRNISLKHGGGGNLKNGHRLLDAYVMYARKKHIEELKRLPEPAKRMKGGRVEDHEVKGRVIW